MKKYIYGMLVIFASLALAGCDDDSWGNEGEADRQHWYFFGFEQWHTKSNDIKLDLKRGETLVVPMQFWSERPQQGIDAVVEYYVVSTLQLGADYLVVDDSGNALTPEADGGYRMVWPNCQKGLQNVNIRALEGRTGTLTLQTWNPARTDDDKISSSNTVIVENSNYKVSAFSQNYKMTITIK